MHFPKSTPEYSALKTYTESWPVIYGPISSRRLNRSLGINLLGAGQKACSFNCIYCELGWTELRMRDIKTEIQYPSVDHVEAELRARLNHMIETNELPDCISIVGNGEPTLHPEFESVAQTIVKIRDELTPELKINILTNGTTLDSKKIVTGLNLLDERMVKLDAGNEDLLKRMNSPLVRITLTKLIAGTRRLKDVILQSCFVQGFVDNTQHKDVEDWMECVGLVNPKLVHIYSIDRVPPQGGLIRVTEDRLDVIGAQLERRTRIKSLVFR